VLALANTERGLWIATENAQLVRLQDARWEILTAENSALPDANVQTLVAAPDVLWIGTSGAGLVRLHSQQWQLLTAENSLLPHNSVLAVAVTTGGVWVGTEGAGLAHMRYEKPLPEIAHLMAD
jgi:ligand-binding sensor domain-containing protein